MNEGIEGHAMGRVCPRPRRGETATDTVQSSHFNFLQGIRFHGLSIPECQQQLTPAPGGKEIIAESMLWLLLTGKVPTEAQTRSLSKDLAERGKLPAFLETLVDSYVVFLRPW